MIDHSDKKLDYALRAIQHPQLRETDEFLQWIGIPENKELFLELMACKEAVIRENLQRKRKYRKKMRILAIASSACLSAASIRASWLSICICSGTSSHLTT